MPLLTIDSVDLAFGHVPLLDAANMQIDARERVCIVGRNGSGKSSLLKLISGEQEADGGRIWRADGLVVAGLAQEAARDIDGTTSEVVAGGLPAGDDAWTRNNKVERVLSRLQLDPEVEFSTLSGGLQRRVLLARALVTEPDLLLLDEPTNHLDLEAIAWLEKFLRGFGGSVLFVAHDRTFLRNVATRIVELDRGKLSSWPGDYDNFLRRRDERRAAEETQNALADKRLAAEERWVRQGIKARRTRNEGRVRALKALRAKRAERLAPVGQAKLKAQQSEASARLVFEAENLHFEYGDDVVIEDFSTRIMRGDKIGLIGPNGCGKTTLLRCLLGDLEPQTGRIRRGERLSVAYFDQLRMQLDPNASVQDSVADGASHVSVGTRQRHVISYLQDFLFAPERARSPVRSLSGGERNRLLLARLFAQPNNLLILDEPSNDLDIETLELLEDLLLEYAGTLLLVSHDRELLNNVVGSVIAFEGAGVLAEYVGGYDDWLRQRPAAQDAATAAKAAKPAKQTTAAKPPKRAKLGFNETRELAGLPAKIESLEADQAALTAQLADPAFYRQPGADVTAVSNRLVEVEQELGTAYGRWETLEAVSRGEAAKP